MTHRIFNIASVALINREDPKDVTILDTPMALTLNMAPEFAEQKSGPSHFPIDAGVNAFSSEVTLTFGEYSRDIIRKFLASVDAGPEPTGLLTKADISYSNQANKFLETFMTDPNTTRMKPGIYRLAITSVDEQATARDQHSFGLELQAIAVPGLGRDDYENYFNNGRPPVVESGTLMSGGALTLGEMRLTGQSADNINNLPNGIDDIKVGDAMIFTTSPAANHGHTHHIGRKNATVKKVKLVARSKNIGSDWQVITIPKILFAGLNFNFAQEFSANEFTGKALYDEDLGYAVDIFSYKK